MPKKSPPPANKNAPVNPSPPASDSSTSESQVAVSGIVNTEEALQTLGSLSLADQASGAQAALTGGATAAAIGTKPKIPQTSAKKSGAKISAGATTSSALSSAQDAAAKSTEARTKISSATSAYSPQADPRATEILNRLKHLKSIAPNTKNTLFEKSITEAIYSLHHSRITLTSEQKLTLINIISELDLYLWSNMSFVHLFLALGFCGVFIDDIPQDVEHKQAQLFKELLILNDQVIQTTETYQGRGLYSYVSQVIKIISGARPSLLNENKSTIKNSFADFIYYLTTELNIKEDINNEDAYKIVASAYELSKRDVISQKDAGLLVKPFIKNKDVIESMHNFNKQKRYALACHYLIVRDAEYKDCKDRITSIYNQSIDLIGINPSDPHGSFHLFDDIVYLHNQDLIHLENCNLERLMKALKGNMEYLLTTKFFASFYIALYNLEATPFAKTAIYKQLKQEYIECLDRNVEKITPANLAKIDEYLTRNKESYLEHKKLDFKVVNALDKMLTQICSEQSEKSKENCLAALDIFSRKSATDIHIKHLAYFKESMVPILLNNYEKLTYNEKIKLMKILPSIKKENYDQICRKMIAELGEFLTKNTDDYLQESRDFLQAIINLGDFNKNMPPFIKLAKKALTFNEKTNKLNLIRHLKFYSFAYSYLALQQQESHKSTEIKRELNKTQNEMKEKMTQLINLLESQHKKYLVNDNKLVLNYANALLNTGVAHKVNFTYSESEIQNYIYDHIMKRYKLEKDKDIQMEVSLFGLPGIDIYLDKYKLAIEIDGDQHYHGFENQYVKGRSLMQKVILEKHGIKLINIPVLNKQRELTLKNVQSKLDEFFSQQDPSRLPFE